MKNSLFAMLLTILYAANSYAQHPPASMNDSLSIYNSMLSEQEMLEDLQLLVDIHKKANSGLYTYHTKQQIDSVYDAAFESVKKPMRVLDFYKLMLHLADYEGSVHNYTMVDLDLVNFLNRQQSFFPFPLIYINGQIIFDGQSAAIPPGSRITSINGVRDVQLMQSFYKYYPADGYTVTRKMSASVNRSFGINYLLEYGLSDEYMVAYSLPNSNAVKTATFPAVTLAEREQNIKNSYSAPVTDLINFKTQSPYSFRMLNPSVGLLNLRWFGMVTGLEDPDFDPYVQFLDSVFVGLQEDNVANLIIDVRNNPGGSDPTFEQPVMYLTDHPFKENVKANIIFNTDSLPYEKYFWGVSITERMDSISLAAGKEFLKGYYPVFENKVSWQSQKYNPIYYPKSPTFKGNLYLLINENVASAASHFASLVKGYVENVTIVGVETVGGYYVHNGHFPLIYELPNSRIKTQFSIVHVQQDAPKKESQPAGRGIMPDYEVWPSLDDFFQHKDTQMEFALKLIADRRSHLSEWKYHSKAFL